MYSSLPSALLKNVFPGADAYIRRADPLTDRDGILNLRYGIPIECTEEAKRLIRYTDKPLAAIGSYLGFSSQSHFIRVFRKYAGVNPGEYLEKHRK